MTDMIMISKTHTCRIKQHLKLNDHYCNTFMFSTLIDA